MCDRTKVEVMARELCITFYGGIKSVNKHETDIRTYTEEHWKYWVKQATCILDVLEKHK